jgi:hypothetical protein
VLDARTKSFVATAKPVTEEYGSISVDLTRVQNRPGESNGKH